MEARRSKSRGRCINDIRLTKPDIVVAESKPLQGAGPKIFRHRVALVDQAKDDVLCLRLLEVKSKAACVAVRAKENLADPTDPGTVSATPMTLKCSLRRLDFDDLCFHVR
jgi:hypothetical protein